MKSTFSALPGKFWAILAVLALLLGVGGYALGAMSGGDHASQNLSGRAASAQGVQPNPQAIDALAAMAPAGADGTAGPGPQTKDGNTYDATIQGSGMPMQQAQNLLDLPRRNAHDPFAIGPADAPVVISEFSDFECPYCAHYTTQIEPEIIRDYVDKGLVRIEWNDLPINGDKAVKGAQAGRAAAKQGKFQEFKKALYADAVKKGEGHPNYSINDYVRFAKEAGVPNVEQFRKEAEGDTFKEPVAKSAEFGQTLGVQATPSFVIGSQPMQGAQPVEQIRQIIDAQLAQIAAGNAPDGKSEAHRIATGAAGAGAGKGAGAQQAS